jgi:hypothetical protein
MWCIRVGSYSLENRPNEDKHSSLFRIFKNIAKKIFNIGTCVPFYKTCAAPTLVLCCNKLECLNPGKLFSHVQKGKCILITLITPELDNTNTIVRTL